MSSAFSAAISNFRHRLPSKRTLDDYASVTFSLLTSTTNMRPSKPSQSSSSSLSTIHFFVRSDSKTLVLYSHPSSIVNYVIGQSRSLTGIPISSFDHRTRPTRTLPQRPINATSQRRLKKSRCCGLEICSTGWTRLMLAAASRRPERLYIQ